MSTKVKTVRQQEHDAVVLRSGRFVYSKKRQVRAIRRSVNQAVRIGREV